MNTQNRIATLDNVLSNIQVVQFTVNRHDTMGLADVMDYVELCRSKGVADLNIAKNIQVNTSEGKVTLAKVMKQLAAGSPQPAASVIPNGVTYSYRIKYGTV